MRKVLALSRLYLTGCFRRQAHLATVLVSAALLVLPSYINAFSMGVNAYERVAKDFGLTLMALTSVGTAIVLGSTTLSRDLTTRALYPLLARPIPRGQYLAAHLLALLVFLGGSLLFQGLCLGASLAWLNRTLDTALLTGTYALFLQAAVVAAVCLTFSVRSSPALAGTIGLATFLIGNLSSAFIRFFLVEDRGSTGSAVLAKGLKTIVPNLANFNIKDVVVHHLVLPPGYVLSVTYYAVIWVVLLMLLARLAFQRLDL